MCCVRILWAPWRMSYIRKASEVAECIFCKASSSVNDEENLVVFRTKHSVVMLNAYPYNTGHVMVAPRRHVPRVEMLYDYEALDLFNSLKTIIECLNEEYRPDGYNIGINIGKVAGAGVEAHLHIHVVPRWLGDTNYMPIIADTKVMPEDLKTTLTRLKSRLAGKPGSSP